MNHAGRLAACFLAAWLTMAAAQERVQADVGLASESSWRELTAQGRALEAEGDYRQAVLRLEQAHDMALRLFGPDHSNLALAQRYLANVHRLLYDYARAEPLSRRSLATMERVHGPEHLEVGMSLNNLAIVHEELGRYALAEPMLLRSLSILERRLPPDDERIVFTLNNLGNLYVSMGAYGKAESYYQRGLDRLAAQGGAESEMYPLMLESLGKLYEYRGDVGRAQPMLERAIQMQERMLGPDHPSLSRAFNNLANFWVEQREYARAEPLFRRALDIATRKLGEDNLGVAVVRTNLGNALRAMGQGMQARALHEQSLESVERLLGPDHPGRAVVLRHLADTYRDAKDPAAAAALYRSSLALMERSLGPHHPDVPDLLIELAALAWAGGDRREAVGLAARATSVLEHNMQSALHAGDERQKRIHLDRLGLGADLAVSVHLRGAKDDPAAARLAAEAVLRRKGRVLEALTDTYALLRKGLSSEGRRVLDRLRDVRAQRAQLMIAVVGETGFGAAPERLAALRSRDEALDAEQRMLETAASEHGAALGDPGREIALADVLAALPPDTSLVEWVVYRPFDPQAASASNRLGPKRYAVYVYRANREPVGADLGEAEAIDELVTRFQDALSDPLRGDVHRLARRLHESLLQPVEEHLAASRRLLVVPDGALGLIPFAPLVDRADRSLVERHALSHLGSGRDLLRLRNAGPRSAPLLVAAPDFGARPARDRADDAKDPATRGRPRPVAGVPWPFQPLPAAAAEAHALRRLVPGMTVHTGQAASKAALREARGPAVLHIATHGFVLEGGGDEQEAVPEKGLLLSGLALAGANGAARHDHEGILTSLEAAGLDLWGTQLAVLSACETGLGTVHAGEGIYSMRRALAMAGAQTQVASLWKVEDEATRRLMTRYYRRLARGEDRVDAMRLAQLAMKRAAATRHPYYWAGFVISGRWGPVALQGAASAGRP